MNKVIVGLILAVCVLGMALVMLNERLGRKSEPTPPITQATQGGKEYRELTGLREPTIQPDYDSPVRQVTQPNATDEARALAAEVAEEENARAALAPPAVEKPRLPEIPDIPLPPARADRSPEPQKADAQKSGDDRAKSQDRPAEKPAAKAAAPEKTPARQDKAAARAPERDEKADRAQAAAAAQQPAKPRAPLSHDITRFVVFARENGATVRLNGNGPMKYRVMNLENPDRVVLDIDGDWKFPEKLEVPKNDLVNSVRVGRAGDRTRLVIDLKEKPRVNRVIPSKSRDGLDLRVDR